MRVLYLAVEVKLSDAGGDAVHVIEATRALAMQAQVDLVVPPLKGKAQEAPALDAMGVRVHSVDTASDAKTAKAIAALARESASEVIYERRYSPKIGASVSQTTGLPLVVEVNGLPDVEASILGTAPKRSRPEKAVRSLIRKTFYTRASKVVTVTRGLADALRDRYGLPPEKLVVVPNAADTVHFAPRPAEEAKRALGIPEDSPVVGWVGNLVAWHGLAYLVEAAGTVLTANPAAVFLIVGGGPERKPLEKLVRDRGMAESFRFTGSVDHAEVPAYIAAADACVVLIDVERYSVQYGFSPLKLYEYLACGRPVVATRTAGFEVVEEGDCGLLVDPRDPEAVAAALLSLLEDPERGEKGRRARAVALERFSWKAPAGERLAVMREVAPEQPEGESTGRRAR